MGPVSNDKTRRRWLGIQTHAILIPLLIMNYDFEIEDGGIHAQLGRDRE